MGDLKVRKERLLSNQGSRGLGIRFKKKNGSERGSLLLFFPGSGLWDDVTGIHALVDLVR